MAAEERPVEPMRNTPKTSIIRITTWCFTFIIPSF
jgi:hypothetical protein